MKKIVVGFIIIIAIVAAGKLKASTKQRVFDLENRVVDLSKSERRAWDTIEAMNRQVTELERRAAMNFYKMQKQLAESCQIVDTNDTTWVTQEEDIDEEIIAPRRRRNR